MDKIIGDSPVVMRKATCFQHTRGLSPIIFTLLIGMTGMGLAADGPRVIFTKSFPGSDPAYVSIIIDKTGNVEYKEAQEDDPEKFQVEPGTVTAIFDFAEKLGHFKGPLESGLKVARMGDKTFRWENGAESSQSTFNYSQNENAKALQDWFESIGESERLFQELQQAIKHDRLGVNDAVLHIDAQWEQRRLTGLAQFLPQLDRVAKDEVFINMARDRAGRLAAEFRAATKAPQE
jgi:hypothetical protein